MKNRLTEIILSSECMSDVSAVLLPNAFETTSPFTDTSCLRDFQTRLTACQVSNLQKGCCCSGRPCMTSSRLSIHRCGRSYSATCPEWFCRTFYAEISVVVVESEIRDADFRQVAPHCVINLTRQELRDVFTS